MSRMLVFPTSLTCKFWTIGICHRYSIMPLMPSYLLESWNMVSVAIRCKMCPPNLKHSAVGIEFMEGWFKEMSWAMKPENSFKVFTMSTVPDTRWHQYST